MLALYISLKIGLTHPFWAVGTCYVIATPLAGSVRSKGFYRTVGTILSGLMVIITIPLLANYRIIYVSILAGWAGLCLYISLLDRTPRAYIFMLAGYTPAIIGFPILQDAYSMMASTPFLTASDRVQEIIIGLGCSSLVHSLIFPQSIGHALLQRLDLAISDAKQWAVDVLLGVKESKSAPLYRKLAQEITELRLMATHLPFDTHNIRWTTDVVRVLHDRLASLVPIISGMEDRMTALKEGQSEVRSFDWRVLLSDIADWCERGRSSPERARQLRSRIDQLIPETRIHAGWADILKVNFASELHMLINALEDCFRYRHQIEVGVKKGILQEIPNVPVVPNRALHADKGQALMAALGVVVSVLVTTVFWMVTDWPFGFYAPMFASIACSIFATLDNPIPALKSFFRYTLYSVPISALYLLVVIPSTHTVEMLMLVLAPFFIWGGIYMGRPASAGRFLILIMAVVGMLMLYDFGQPDLTTFINGQAAQLFGIGVAFFFTNLLRNVNIKRLVRRVVRSGWAEMAQMAKAMRPTSVAELAVRMTDRISLLAPRLAAVESSGGISSLDLMEDVRVSINMAYLLRRQDFLRQSSVSLEPLMHHLFTYFRDKLSRMRGNERELLIQLDRLLYQVCDLPSSTQKNEVISALAGIRKDMFPKALFYRATVPGKEVE